MTAARKRLGLTQPDFAAVSGVSLRTVQGLESGEITTPQDKTLTRLHALTGLTGPELGFHPRPLPKIVTVTRDRLVTTAAGVLRGHVPASILALLSPAAEVSSLRVGLSDLESTRTRTGLLSGMYDQFGGGSVQGATLVESMRNAGVLLRARYTTASRKIAVAASVAEMALAIAGMLADQGNYTTAQTALLVGLVATRDAGPDKAMLRSRILCQLARASLDCRDWDNANGLLDLADTVGERHRLPGDARALTTALRTSPIGTQGRLKDVRELATRALDLHASVTDPVIPTGEVAFEAGFGLACLELCAGLDVDNATEVLTHAVDSFAPSKVRQRTLAKTFQMLTLTERGDITAALKSASDMQVDVGLLKSTAIRESMALAHLVPRVIRRDREAIMVSSALHAVPVPLPPGFLQTRPSPGEVAAALHAATI